ncbi:ribose-phosphate diphosphokinase [Candidatus Aenigmatarchaeota archaeon]
MILIGNDDFGRKISDKAGLDFIQFEQKTFPDGEICPRIPKIEKSEYVICNHLHRSYNVNTYLTETFLLLRTLRKNNVSCETMIMPYLIYSRQDKIFRKGEPSSLECMIKLFNDNGIKKIITVTSHANRFQKEFKIGNVRITNLDGFSVIGKSMKDMCYDTIIAPDEGVEKIAENISNDFNIKHAIIKKHRDLITGEVKSKWKTKYTIGNKVVIVDDMISSGGTMLKAVDLSKKYTDHVSCAAVHGIFTQGSDKLIKVCLPYVTDTIESEFSKISVTDLIASEINELFFN